MRRLAIGLVVSADSNHRESLDLLLICGRVHILNQILHVTVLIRGVQHVVLAEHIHLDLVR